MSNMNAMKEDLTKEQNFASRYIVDVSVCPTHVMLGDSSRVKYYIDASNSKCLADFKTWFANMFSKGISGKLTLFSYKKVEDEGQIVNVIDNFLSVSLAEQTPVEESPKA